MYFEINSKEMAKVAKLCKKVINKKTVLPILIQAKVDVSSGKVTFSCTDLEIGLIISLECLTQGQGTLMLPLKTIEGIKPNGKVIVRYENSIEVKKDTGSVMLKPDNVEDFPQIQKDPIQYTLNDDFIEKIDGCLPSVSTEETRYVLNGICLQRDVVASTDGRRLHLFETNNTDVFSEFSSSGIIVPTKTAKILIAIAKTSKKEIIRVGMDSKVIAKERGKIHPMQPELARPKIQEPTHITFQIGDITLVSKLIEGKFPRFRHVFPSDSELQAEIRINKTIFQDALKNSLDYILSKDGWITVFFDTNGKKLADIYTQGSVTNGRFNTSIPFIPMNGTEPFGFNVNPRYLLDALSVIDEEEVHLIFYSSSKPLFFKSSNGCKMLIMPVKGDDEPISYEAYCEKERRQMEEIKKKENDDSELAERSNENQAQKEDTSKETEKEIDTNIDNPSENTIKAEQQSCDRNEKISPTADSVAESKSY